MDKDNVSSLADFVNKKTKGPTKPPEIVKGSHVSLAARVCCDLKRAYGLVISSDGSVWRYHRDKGIWITIPKDRLGYIIGQYDGKLCIDDSTKKGVSKLKLRSSDIEGVTSIVFRSLLSFDDETPSAEKTSYFSDATTGISVKNGYLLVSVDPKCPVKLVPHDPKYKCRYYLDVDYDPSANHPMLDKFFSDIFGIDEDGAEKTAFLQEFAGACLLGVATKYQTCALLLGEGGDGKSTTIEILSSIMPSGCVSASQPESWVKATSVSKLEGKLLNTAYELPDRDLVNGEAFKQVICGEPIAARMLYRDEYSTMLQAGHIFSTNALPTASDLSKGFFRRFAIIRYNRQFAPTEMDRTIAKRISTVERQGLLSWAIAGAIRLVARGTYDPPKSSDVEKSKWAVNSDNVSAYLQDMTVKSDVNDSMNRTQASVLYKSYREWCAENGARPVSACTFGARLKRAGVEAKKSGQMYYGVSILAEPTASWAVQETTAANDVAVTESPPVVALSSEPPIMIKLDMDLSVSRCGHCGVDMPILDNDDIALCDVCRPGYVGHSHVD